MPPPPPPRCRVQEWNSDLPGTLILRHGQRALQHAVWVSSMEWTRDCEERRETSLAATTWVPMGAQVPLLSPNDHPNPSQGRQKDFRKSQISKKKITYHQTAFKPAMLGLWGGGGGQPGLHGPSSHYGSPWVLKYPYCHQTIQPIPGATDVLRKKSNFRKHFQSTHASVKTAVLTGNGPFPGGGGGGDWGTRSLDPGLPPLGPRTRKQLSGPGSDSTHSGHNMQRSFDPPAPPNPPPTQPPKPGYPDNGGGGG